MRTPTWLYNKRPTWLADAHASLDSAVLAAYGWLDSPTVSQLLDRLLALNRSYAAGESTATPAPGLAVDASSR